MVAADLQRIPPLSLARALSLPHGDFDVLLGVGMDGQPVTHPARVRDGGAPSLVIVGMDGDDVAYDIIVSCISWYQDTATWTAWCDAGFDPNPYLTGITIEWHEALLRVTWRQQVQLTVTSATCYCKEIRRGSWLYHRRNCAPVGFYACREG